MASSAPPSEATKVLVLSLINNRLCALRKKRKRILQMESIHKEQEDVLRSKPSVLASIKELKKLRRQFSSALRDDDAPAALEKGEANNNLAANDGTAEGASSTHTSAEDQGMDISLGYDYEVFLSFRGPDTRIVFTDFLYTSLQDVGIHVFKDDTELRVGEEFGPKLLQAIEESKISIPIFSKGYASSVWCLKELAKMVEFQKAGRQKIMPIFYNVAPSVVRYQTGRYGKAFLSHEKKGRYGHETICQWKDALTAVGAINGWDLHSEKKKRRQGEFAKTVTDMVFSELKKAHLVVSDFFVNVDNHVSAIMKMIGDGTSETRIIGIHGMGGIGKTTIAKIIYNQLSNNFKHCCFLSNIREMSERKGIEYLQNQLISGILKTKWQEVNTVDDGINTIQERLRTKKILLLLDDVDNKKHMDALVGNRNWFGTGSKLIITTRNEEVLKGSEVDDSYEVSGMDPDQSLQLFSKHAFRDSPLDGYINQSKRAISIAGGLPLALKVIGSLLFNIKKEKWDGKLEELENIPPEDVQSKLKISYNALRFREKHIFLDIACLFIGYDKDIMVHFWDKSKFFPDEAMEVLQNMSLISIEKDNEVWMHDVLRDLGREIVLEECNLKIEKQSRVWDPKEGLDLLRKHKGKTEVEALRLELDLRQYRFTYEGFESLSDLRFLEVGGSMENFHAEERLLCPANENSYLLPKLRWLSWHHIPPTFNITNFFMEDVVFLDLSRSEITDEWEGWSHMKVMKNLKVMDLSFCRHLKRNPNFSSTHSSLERLILTGCDSLIEIDGSIGQLKCLVSLDLFLCSNLQKLPDELGRDLASLKHLFLRECFSLERLPNTIGNLKSLIELDIHQNGIKGLPDSIGNLESLVKLRITDGKITKLPDSFRNLKSLVELRISGIQELPDFFEKLQNLKIVQINLSYISKIPNTLWTIEKLEEISVNMMHNYYDVEIGNCICKNRCLRILRLRRARIDEVPRLPESLVTLDLERLYMDTIPDLSNLTNLKEFFLIFGPRDDSGESDGPVEEYPMPRWIGNLSKLEKLALCSPYVTTLPSDISSLLPQLRRLHISCPNLHCLPSLPSSLSSLYLLSDYVTTLPTDISLLSQLRRLTLVCRNLRCLPSLPSSLLVLELCYCKSMCSMENLSNLKKLSRLGISNCPISEIRGLDGLESLRELCLSGLRQVEIVSDLSNLSKLSNLEVHKCGKLVEIQGEPPPSLIELRIYECGSLWKLPDLSSLEGLWLVSIKGCRKLNVETISSLCSEKSIQFYGDKTNQTKKTDEYEYGLEGEDVESEFEYEEDFHEFGYESEVEGEDGESEGEDED